MVLPFASTRLDLTSKAQVLLSQMPVSAAYGKTVFLEANLQRPDGKRRVKSALTGAGAARSGGRLV